MYISGLQLRSYINQSLFNLQAVKVMGLFARILRRRLCSVLYLTYLFIACLIGYNQLALKAI